MVQKILHRAADAAVVVRRAQDIHVSLLHPLLQSRKSFGLVGGIRIKQRQRFVQQIQHVHSHSRGLKLLRGS